MQIGLTENLKSLEDFKKQYPGLDHNSIWLVANYIDKKFADSLRDQYIFIFPDVQEISEEIKITPKQLIDSLVFLSTAYNDRIYPAQIFEHPLDGEIYLLNQFEKDDLKNENVIYDRRFPETLHFKDASSKIRNAFVVKFAKTV